jgi:hypothetical protein
MVHRQSLWMWIVRRCLQRRLEWETGKEPILIFTVAVDIVSMVSFLLGVCQETPPLLKGTRTETKEYSEGKPYLIKILLVAKFHSEYPSFYPQTFPDYVLSSWLDSSIFFVFRGIV